MTDRCLADIGGQDGFGPIAVDQDEPFAASWESRAMALMFTTAATGSWNVDHARSVLETLPNYHQLSYYEKWMEGLKRLTIETGLLHPDEIASARVLYPARPVQNTLRAADVAGVLSGGASTQRPASAPARFAVGDLVRTRATASDHHTRLPGYARGKVGRIESLHGAHVFPDTHAQGAGEQPQWLYTVAFSGPQNSSVSIDAWESYLEPAA